MNKLKISFLVMFLSWFNLAISSSNVATVGTYETAIKSKKCKEGSSQLLSCEYKIGQSLHISINGIGAPDTGISFMKSDFHGDFYGTYGVGHGCIIISSGSNSGKGKTYYDYAFISPKNGKIYKNWRECKSGYWIKFLFNENLTKLWQY